MADIERIKRNIRLCIDSDSRCFACEYKRAEECTMSLLRDALSVIEELQANAEQTQQEEIHIPRRNREDFICPECAVVLNEFRDNFCPNCGIEIEWEGAFDE